MADDELPGALADLNVFRLLLSRPRLAKGVAGLLLSLLFGTELPARLRELIIMRVAWATGSAYEWAQHWRIAADEGVGEADLVALRDWREAPFGDREAAVLSATDEVLSDGVVAPATLARLEELIGPGAALEAVATAGAWSMLSTLLRTFQVPLDDDLSLW